MYRSRLVPRCHPDARPHRRPAVRLLVVGYILGITDGGSAWHAVAVAPIFFWELSIGLWMTFKGFRKDAPLMIEAAESDRHGRLGRVRLDRRSASPRRRASVTRRVVRLDDGAQPIDGATPRPLPLAASSGAPAGRTCHQRERDEAEPDHEPPGDRDARRIRGRAKREGRDRGSRCPRPVSAAFRRGSGARRAASAAATPSG
jgi:hypothetical protein